MSVGAPVVKPPIAAFGLHNSSLLKSLFVVPLCIHFPHFFRRHLFYDCNSPYCPMCTNISVVLSRDVLAHANSVSLFLSFGDYFKIVDEPSFKLAFVFTSSLVVLLPIYISRLLLA